MVGATREVTLCAVPSFPQDLGTGLAFPGCFPGIWCYRDVKSLLLYQNFVLRNNREQKQTPSSLKTKRQVVVHQGLMGFGGFLIINCLEFSEI